MSIILQLLTARKILQPPPIDLTELPTSSLWSWNSPVTLFRIRLGDRARQSGWRNKNLTRSSGIERRRKTLLDAGGTRRGRRVRAWQRGRVYDSRYAKGERDDSETRYYPTVLLRGVREEDGLVVDGDGRSCACSSMGHFQTIKRQRSVLLSPPDPLQRAVNSHFRDEERLRCFARREEKDEKDVEVYHGDDGTFTFGVTSE